MTGVTLAPGGQQQGAVSGWGGGGGACVSPKGNDGKEERGEVGCWVKHNKKPRICNLYNLSN